MAQSYIQNYILQLELTLASLSHLGEAATHQHCFLVLPIIQTPNRHL